MKEESVGRVRRTRRSVLAIANSARQHATLDRSCREPPDDILTTSLSIQSCLSLGEGINTGQHQALEKLERRTATSGDVRHLLGKASLLDSRDGIATADDGDGALPGALGESLGHVVGARRELLPSRKHPWARSR